MIRLSTTARPESWYDIEINIDGDTAPMRVKYHLLNKREAADWTGRRLGLAKAVRTEDEATTFDLLIEELEPEQMERVDALLRARVLDWDLQDADNDGAKLPANEQNLSVVLGQTRFWRPLFQGLLDASSGIAAKKTDATGSAGGSTTSKPR